jgi:hypothetical protein
LEAQPFGRVSGILHQQAMFATTLRVSSGVIEQCWTMTKKRFMACWLAALP